MTDTDQVTARASVTPGVNPARFTPAILERIGELLPAVAPPGPMGLGHMVYDPFAGEGRRLGALCDRLGYLFAGGDLVAWQDQDPRVAIADATLPDDYPSILPFVVVTSPTYNNGMGDSFTPTNARRRMTYTARAGAPLGPTNTGRWNGRGSKQGERMYWSLHRLALEHWSDRCIVNVKDSVRSGEVYRLVDRWVFLLEAFGYVVTRHDVEVPGYRDGANRDLRVDAEAILVAVRS